MEAVEVLLEHEETIHKEGEPHVSVSRYLKIVVTVKLGYNDHGYNEFTAITNKFNSTFHVPNYYLNVQVLTISRL